MTDTVIIFASFSGKTRKVAKYLADAIGADIFDLKLQTQIDLSAYSRVILGTGVHAGNPYSKLTTFIEDNRAVLNDKSLFLFISCLYKGERAEKQCMSIKDELGVNNAVFFSTRGEKNAAGLSSDIDAFVERMKA